MSVLINNRNIPSLFELNKLGTFVRKDIVYSNLVKKHPILDVIPWSPSSHGTYHESKKVTSLGKGEWVRLNDGYKPSKGSTETNVLPVQLFKSESNISEDALNATPGNAITTRQNQDLMIGLGCVEQFCDTLFNGVDDDELTMKGLPYYRQKLGKYCLDAGATAATGDETGLTSMYLIEVDPMTPEEGVNFHYNKNLTGMNPEFGIGLTVRDRGLGRWTGNNGGDVWGWSTTFDMTAMTEVKWENRLIRIANVDPDSALDVTLFDKMITRINSHGLNACLVCNSAMIEAFRKRERLDATWHQTDLENFGVVFKYNNLSIVFDDSITVNETKVS